MPRQKHDPDNHRPRTILRWVPSARSLCRIYHVRGRCQDPPRQPPLPYYSPMPLPAVPPRPVSDPFLRPRQAPTSPSFPPSPHEPEPYSEPQPQGSVRASFRNRRGLGTPPYATVLPSRDRPIG